MIGVDLHALDHAARGEAHDRPVVPWSAPPLCLPTVAHVRRAAGENQVLPVAVEHVAADDDEAAVLHRREIEEANERSLVRRDDAVHAQPGDAAIRIDIETEMRRAARGGRRRGVRHGEHVARVAGERGPRQDLRPPRPLAREVGGRGCTRQVTAVDARVLGVIAGEVAGVDDDAVHHTRRAESNDRPIVPGRAAASRLPAIHPLPTLGVRSLSPLRRRRLEHGFLGREKLVVGGDDRPAQLFRGEIDQVREVGHRSGGRRSSPTGVSANAPSM